MTKQDESESMAAFARRVGKSRSQVSRYRQQGMPLDSDGRVPIKRALAWLRQNVAPQDGQAGGTLAERKAEKLAWETEKARLEVEQQRGALVDRERAERQMFDLARQVAASWQSWPNRVSPEIAAELGCDPATVERVLRRKVNEHLSSLSASLRGATE